MQAVMVLQVPVPPGTADDMVNFCLDFRAKATEAELVRFDEVLTNLGVDVDDDIASHEFTLEDQLERFKKFWPKRSTFLMAIHEGLVDLGYDAVVPEIRGSATKPSQYLRYVDQADGATMGTTNSGSFTFAGKSTQDKLKDVEGVELTRDGARFQFDTQDKVDLILKIAKELKA
jgi:hypothetical protein